MDILDEDLFDKVFKVNFEINDLFEDVSKSDFDVEVGDDDMVDGFILVLEDEGDSSFDEDGGMKRLVVKGIMIVSRF